MVQEDKKNATPTGSGVKNVTKTEMRFQEILKERGVNKKKLTTQILPGNVENQARRKN
ncbi:hypothetical protein H744_2c2998 [Photobacterium gaetbulicola Gung47]|uniref:Uncharacterized protein n=2 Tax=Photobacterium gaetbulicola TaxID=1295392 RepID=A0A0C5WX93_9GAMM|nr:hypothetical protein H744_2c2998 [Photobacterium gaetbulicola Gung47]